MIDNSMGHGLLWLKNLMAALNYKSVSYRKGMRVCTRNECVVTGEKLMLKWEYQFKFFPRTFLEIFWAFSLAEIIILTCNSVIWLVNSEQFHERGPCTPLDQQSAQFLSNSLWLLVDISVQKISKTNIHFSKVPKSKISTVLPH